MASVFAGKALTLSRPRNVVVSVSELIDSATSEELQSIANDPSASNVNAFCAKATQQLYERHGWTTVTPPPSPSPSELRYELLRFLVTEERSRAQIQGLAERDPSFDRDQAVMEVWRVLAGEDAEYIAEKHFSIVYHQRRLFAWFVDRYDLRRAREIFAPQPWLHSGLQLVPLLAALAALFMASSRLSALAVVGGGYVVPLLVWRLVQHLSPVDFVQSLVPRLAGTAAAGAALMLSAKELMGFLRDRMGVGESLGLLGAAALYLALEIIHRVHPRLGWRKLANRVANIVFLALAHAVAIVLLILPAIHHLLGDTTAKSSPTELFAFTTAVFTAGLILNVIWAEEPITRPL